MSAHTTNAEKHPLDDPEIDFIWVRAAVRLGFAVERTTSAYASTDGRGVIAIGTPQTLDGDDCLGQLVFHELCHALCQGEANLTVADWGLDNTSEEHVPNEHACLRVQAHLADRHALRALMTPTTVTRPYYQALAAFPLDGADQSARLAQAALRGSLARWVPVLDEALADTARLVRAGGRWSSDGGQPLGMKLRGSERCGGCVWRSGGAGQGRCRQVTSVDGNGQRVDDDYPACVAWEAALDCQDCGACCREGFDSVSVGVREAVTWQHPHLVVRQGPRFSLARAAGRCAALTVAGTRFACAIYSERPQACREVQPGGRRCLVARRRVGLSLHA